ncbi:MAG: HD domain-containing phosphohydrolase, partial [Sulfuricaulis sp.]|nr:HD domain-containing phosphohydrolase [Sulfuricaulis sp.]
APLEFATHRLMAVMAATKMQEVFARTEHPWQMRIGIASGPAITGLIGSKRQTYTAIGDIVNLAARLEKHCVPGRVLVDAYTYEDVKPFFEARKVHALPNKDHIDLQKEQELERLHEQLLNQPEAADLIFRTGEIYMQIQEPVEALAYFERALQLDGSNTAFKVAYAEAGLKISEHGKITVKGKRQRVEAYELMGMKDPLADPARIPRGLYNTCKLVVDEIKIPSDVTLPSEVLDGSVGHSRVVAALSYALAGHFGLLEREKLEIMRAGFLADIGKEMIPNHILNRRGALTSSERDIINQHPDEACRMMRKMGYDDISTLAAVRHSHERFDGTGYPERLKEKNIPIGSRIIAVADSYDALTAWRAYREPWERSAVLGELHREVEKGAFDPAVVAALAQLLG